MIILNAVKLYNKLLFIVDREVILWRVEKTIDSQSIRIIPSYTLIKTIEMYFEQFPLDRERVLGIMAKNSDFIHGLAMWCLSGRTVKIAESVIPMVLSIDILKNMDASTLYKFPCQSIYIDNQFGGFDGAIVCKDYIDGGRTSYLLNVSLLKLGGGKGLQLSFALPQNKGDDFLDEIKGLPEWNLIEPFFKVFLYIINGYMNRDDFIAQKNNDFFGFDLSDRIEQNKGRKGYWRNGHWHTYYVKNNGVDQFEMKLIQPTWVSK